jgi:hypothetical protein
MGEGKVRSIGGCPVCRRSAVLVDGACAGCARRFGPRFAALAARLRREPEFKRTCYEALSTDFARREFVDMFGEVAPRDGAMDQPNMHQRSR